MAQIFFTPNFKGFQQAIISSYELINGRYEDGRHIVKFTKLKPPSKKELALIPEKPRALLLLGMPGFQSGKFEGWDTGTKPSWKRPTRSERGGLC
jgi:hypothetical protein